MRNFLFPAVLLLCNYFSPGQLPLSSSRKTSFFTYVYKLTEKETEELYYSQMKNAGEKYLHELVDSFPTSGSTMPKLADGNYVLIHARDNELDYELKTTGSIIYKLINNNRDLAISISSQSGELINDATVYLDRKLLYFDQATQTYRLAKRNKPGLLKIHYHNTIYLFPVNNKSTYYNKNFNLLQKLSHSFPLKYITKALRNKNKYRNNYHNYFDIKTASEKGFNGFLVFDKPKYKPGDTVRLKAYVVNKKGRPFNKKVLLRLTGKDFKVDTILAEIDPYRPGGYEYEFPIKDSLGMSLDDQQMITLETLKSRKYDPDSYEGDLDDDEMAMKRRVLMRGKFYYEDYELGGIKFNARTDKKVHQRGNPVSIYLSARDENDLAVMDGRVQIIVTTSEYGAKSYYRQNVFLPDTLWDYSQPLDMVGETRINIPDSIFPAASFDYNIQCFFLNSNNEFKSVELNGFFENDRHKIFFNKHNDSLLISQLDGLTGEQMQATLYAFDENDDTVFIRALRLPEMIPINPFVKYYEVETESAHGEFNLTQQEGTVNCLSYRTRDSVYIKAINPDRLHFWYSIFSGNKLVHQGYGDTLYYRIKTTTLKSYFVSLQYIYGGSTHNENFIVPFRDKLLNISVDQSEYVYPGETSPVNISVSDANGKPAGNVDITAYAFTTRFENEPAPYIPYMGRIRQGRRMRLPFFPEKIEDLTGEEKLNWIRWSKEMGLDSIEYFRFLHPYDFYVNTEPATDQITQIAPFVVNNGNIQLIQQVYIDEIPYYFNQAQQLQRYSFKVDTGRHSLRLRTYNSLIRVDSVWAYKGMKTFISINSDTTKNRLIKIERMPDTLTAYEKSLWTKYLILLDNNFGENFASLKQPGRIFLINPDEKNTIHQPFVLTGPLENESATLSVKNKFEQSFEPEGNYLFDIEKGLIKQKQLPYGRYPFHTFLFPEKPVYNFKDMVLTAKEIDSLWQDYLDNRSANEELLRNVMLNKVGNGSLRIAMENDKSRTRPFVKNVLLFRYDDPDFARVYKGNSRDLGYIQPGAYRLFLLFKGDDYFIKDSIVIKKDGINYFNLGDFIPLKRDSVSSGISRIIESREIKWTRSYTEYDLGRIKETFNEKYLDPAVFSRFIYGKVTDREGAPLLGASIKIKGTRIGVYADASGQFRLKVPKKGVIVISSVGYESIEIRISETSSYSVKLSPAVSELNDVVVTGYGIARKKNLTASFSVSQDNMLSGKVAGVVMRGLTSVASASPLILIDGIPFAGNIQTLDSSKFASVQYLKGPEAIALYGQSAANGLIVIATRKTDINNQVLPAPTDQTPGNNLRHNFRDAAYWQPKLRTDVNGKVTFSVTYPDDITNWRTFVIAINDRKETGFIEKNVRAFKSLSASLSIPQFAVEGDTINIIGKVLNYSFDHTQVNREFIMNDTLIKRDILQIENSCLDTFSISPTHPDSLKLKYTIQKPDGYFDGEEKNIPVVKQGIMETHGYFTALNKDTSFSIEMDSAKGKIKLYAESSVLPVILDEIENIRGYEYLCNEQIASKLKAMLLKKKIYSYLRKEFKEEENVAALVSKLNKNKMQAGLWGWWDDNDPSMWISLHAIEALLAAEKEGYKVDLNKQAIIDYLVYNYTANTVSDKISSLFILRSLEAKIDFKKYLEPVDTSMRFLTLNEKLKVLLLKKKLGSAISIDSLYQQHYKTMFGNIYWGKDDYHLFDNTVQNTLLMYQLMKLQPGYEMALKKVLYYFLEKRRNGHWANTYESALVLETILPDLLVDTARRQPVSLSINGSAPVQTFPFSMETVATQKITVSKSGNQPVYFTAYQQSWNKQPNRVSGDLSVTSYFEQDNSDLRGLRAGVPARLKITVNVKADADYVMIEIPIPAGCSYKEKSQSHNNYEVHREYFKDKVSIFCTTLPVGTYSFAISLMPRYTGKYHLNPARAEMMYFPIFYGREQEKLISIF